MQRISVVMITLNEEANLIRALESVAWCDEIVILDSGSTDGTMEIASGFSNCRVFLHEFDGYGAQKRRAVDAAANDWVFSLDADEQLDGELQDALRRWSDSEVSDDAGYEVGRQL
ncbi:MAG: glycosyltransferase family 2 protein, partial [Chromatiales bacterium]|nr:glycosyltransferase family 2 protein [Chromatiales bacterium]